MLKSSRTLKQVAAKETAFGREETERALETRELEGSGQAGAPSSHWSAFYRHISAAALFHSTVSEKII